MNVPHDLTKGISVTKMNERWFNGPDFLQLEEQLWPVEDGKADLKDVNAAAITKPVVNSQNFTMLKRLPRVTTYVIHFCHNIHSRSHGKEKNQVNVDSLNAKEIIRAEEYWIKKAQAGLSAGIAKGSYKSLSPFTGQRHRFSWWTCRLSPHII